MTAPTNETTIPDAVDALVTIIAAALATAGENGAPVQVLDGPPVAGTEDDYVSVAFDGDSADAAVEFDFEAADAALGRDGEAYDVACQLSTWSGEAGFSTARRRAFDLLRMIRAAIAADRRLGGVVDKARVTNGHLVHDVDNGAVATVRFAVHVQAWSR